MGDKDDIAKRKGNKSLKKSSESSDEEVGASGSSSFSIDLISKFFCEKLNFHSAEDSAKKVIDDLSFKGIINHWKNGGVKNIITMVGAGISTSAGIPDFRSPGSGLYDNLEKYNLPYPEAIFALSYFNENPKPFFVLAKELYPGTFKPTPAHYFVKLLSDKGLLIRHYTQNIDTLERIAGIPAEKLVEAHGTFFTNHCLNCYKEYSMEWAKEKIFQDKIPQCEYCKCLVKPDIVFFGENLPSRFFELPGEDFKKCDLLIIMGTSLEIQPFASLAENANPNCLRLLINRDKVGKFGGRNWFMSGVNLRYDDPENTKDAAFIGDCDEGVYEIAKILGWEDELRELVKKEHDRIDKNTQKEKEKTESASSSEEKQLTTETS
ncbi:NAD-dependent protein deacetylase Sirt2 [Condylostylus longicornis]|uniref:NAD-dependent protein deacetylase Sirt2 n=1 Tax=Condylostylus longicornis TaxID=2530218 RepID=UPI00244DD5E1|nr:NAD-dependent protein deacetylase Sirt2 [Condylostylus longicornis]